MNNKALLGLKIIEYGNFISVPYCGKLLADLGAEVIKVEDPDLGDESRQHGPFLKDSPHREKSGQTNRLSFRASSCICCDCRRMASRVLVRPTAASYIYHFRQSF